MTTRPTAQTFARHHAGLPPYWCRQWRAEMIEHRRLLDELRKVLTKAEARSPNSGATA